MAQNAVPKSESPGFESCLRCPLHAYSVLIDELANMAQASSSLTKTDAIVTYASQDLREHRGDSVCETTAWQAVKFNNCWLTP